MTNYFVVKLRLFDLENYLTESEVIKLIGEAFDLVSRNYGEVGLEEMKVKKVELEEYEKED